MRTAQICPTCATYINAVCVIYDGPYLANLDVAPLTNLSEIVQQINEVVSTLEPALGFTPENIANKIATAAEVTTFGSSVDKYPSVKAIKDYTDTLFGQVTLQQVLNYNHNLLNGLNFQGTDAGLNNTGTSDVAGIGTNAAKNNSGQYVVAIGLNAGLSNTKNHLNAIGNGAGNQNDGLFVSAIGSAAALQNLGDNVNAMGNIAASSNSGDNVNAFGNSAADTNSGNHVNAIGKSAGVNNTFNDVTLLGNAATASADDQLVFINGAGFNARLSNTNLTANKKYELPNNNGTIALSVNGVTPDSTTGDVTIYKEYVGYFGQFAFGDPTVQIVNNTLSGPIVWTRTSQGNYQGVLVGAFPAAKTFIQQNIQYFQGLLSINAKLEFIIFNDDTINVECRNLTTGAAQDVSLGNIPLQIRVYP